ncbi:MAG: winged helix-turn-helix domain-containing protein [Nitrososphaeraceae archaeon]
MKHRSKVEIIADILETIMADSSMSSSKIMYKAFLSYKQLKEYVPLLLQNELIRHGEKDRTFMITDKGLYYLEMYNNLPEFVGIAR